MILTILYIHTRLHFQRLLLLSGLRQVTYPMPVSSYAKWGLRTSIVGFRENLYKPQSLVYSKNIDLSIFAYKLFEHVLVR